MSEAEPQVRAALDVLFDPAWYAARHSDLVADGESPMAHYLSAGRPQRLDPHPLFDARWYAARHALRDGDDPVAHFVAVGERDGLAPGPYFDPAWYKRTNPDVAAAGVNGLVHYVEYGRSEGRLPSPVFDPAAQAGPLGVWPLEPDVSAGPAEVLGFAPRPTTLARLLAAQEATSFLDPSAIRQIVVRTRPAPTAASSGSALVVGGLRGILHTEGEAVLSAPGAQTGWALAHVTHAVAPPLDAALHLLGLPPPEDAARLERWSARLRDAARGSSSPCLLIDDTLPPPVEARLLAAAGPAARTFRTPARRLLAVERLETPDLDGVG